MNVTSVGEAGWPRTCRGCGRRDGVAGGCFGTRAYQSAGVGGEPVAAVQPGRADREERRDDVEDRDERAGWVRDRFVRAAAPGLDDDPADQRLGQQRGDHPGGLDGGRTPTGEDSLFEFLAQPSLARTYTFHVQQTYSDGSIVNWAGSESSDSPAPTIDVKDSLGGSGVSVVSIIALVVGLLALVAAGFALLRGGAGDRPLA